MTSFDRGFASQAVLKLTLAGLLALFSIFQPTVILAADSPGGEPILLAQAEDYESDVTMRQVTVSVNRVIQDIMEVPQSVSVITAEDIQKMPATTITDILTRIPNVEISMDLTDTSPEAGMGHVALRGESTGRTVILINGVRVVEPNYGYSTVQITPSQIERIEVIKGPSSVLYGPEAIGGVINIITKKGGSKPLGFSTGTTYNTSSEGITLNASVFGRLESGFNYRFSADGANVGDRRFPKGAYDSSGVSIDKGVGSSYRNRDYASQLGYDWGNYSLNLQADRYENHTQTSREMITLPTDTITVTDTTRETILATFIADDLTDFLKRLTFKTSFSKMDRYRFKENPSTGAETEITDSLNKQFANSLQSEFQLGRHNLLAGFEWQRSLVDLTSTTPSPYYSVTAAITQDDMAAFAQDQWNFVDKWFLTLGLRHVWSKRSYDDWSATGTPPTGGGGGGGGGGSGGASLTTYNPNMKGTKVSYSDFISNVGLVYRHSDTLAFRALFSQGKRYPMLTQIFTTGRGVNVDLKPESSLNYEVGARYSGDSLELDAALFFNDAKDFIEEDQNGSGDMENIGFAKTMGSEISVSYRLHELGLTPYANFAVTRRKQSAQRRTLLPASTKSRTPLFAGRAGLQYERPLAEQLNFYGDLRLEFASNAEDRVVARGGDGFYAGWGTANLTVGLTGGGERQYSVSLSLNNIFDKLYAPARSGNVPRGGSSRTLWAPARHIVLGVNYTF
ncbi:MAG: TonB-dependent receptor [Deltaproteobacteria bacterium]|jgi:hemoglobin/transferrin/lactoferrin receptor protein|nr:TonB-dependent receptor [Deltaproteobacteria bacterium]